MKFSEYEKFLYKTSLENELDSPYTIGEFHLLMGLVSEVGEVMQLHQKSMYKHCCHPIYTADYGSKKLKEELGDVLWYLTSLCNYYGFTLSDIMQSNVEKLEKRHNVKR